MTDRKALTANSTFAIGGVSSFVDSFVVAESFVLRMNICAEKPAHRKSANRYPTFEQNLTENKKHEKHSLCRIYIMAHSFILLL
jgi:hypothetical protein